MSHPATPSALHPITGNWFEYHDEVLRGPAFVGQVAPTELLIRAAGGATATSTLADLQNDQYVDATEWKNNARYYGEQDKEGERIVWRDGTIYRRR